MVAPETILYGTLLVYTATGGTARPDQVITSPTGFTLLGTGGVGDQAPGGLKLSHPITTALWRGEGSEPRKAAITEEDFMAEVAIAEFSAANLAMALGGKSLTTVTPATGIPGSKGFDLYRGPGAMTPVALLIRGTSPEMDGGVLEYYVPYAINDNSVESTFQKTDPALIPFVWRAVSGPGSTTARLGQVRFQTAAAT